MPRIAPYRKSLAALGITPKEWRGIFFLAGEIPLNFFPAGGNYTLGMQEGNSLRRDTSSIRQEQLVVRCKLGDNRAFDELFRLWESRLYFFVRRLVANEEDAWDVLQQTWVQVLRGIGRLEKTDRLAPWLYCIARRTAQHHWRGRFRDESHRDEEIEVEDLAEADEDWNTADAEQVHAALAELQLKHREVLTLFFLQDLSIEDIGEVLEVPPGTVKSRLHYAKRALRGLLEAEDRRDERK